VTLQSIMPTADGEKLYSPYRDVAHNFRSVVTEVAGRLEDKRWPALAELLQGQKVTDDELGEACKAFCDFVSSAVDTKGERMEAALLRTGWFNVRGPAQVAYLSVLGTVMMGIYWTGVHEATIKGKGPALDFGELRAAGARCSRLLTVPRWRRWFFRLRERAVAVWRIIRGG